jgi:hypothetical protein
MARIKFELYYNTDTCNWEAINPVTGEIKDFGKKVSKKKEEPVKDEGPKLVLESNKYILTQSAVDLLNAKADDRIEIKFEQQGKVIIPIIGVNTVFGTKGGNKLTKKNTVSFRGVANKELSEYGTEFSLEAHPTKEGIYYLKGNKAPVEVVDDTVEIVDDKESVDMVDDISDLLEDNSDNITEITNFNFDI